MTGLSSESQNQILVLEKSVRLSKDRVIYELLQNADDAFFDKKINFEIHTVDDYLLILHNGMPFNRDDVEAITSVAESTKRNDQKKTGYKGIGFKSVFTDSEEVIVRSGGYSFSFQRGSVN